MTDHHKGRWEQFWERAWGTASSDKDKRCPEATLIAARLDLCAYKPADEATAVQAECIKKGFSDPSAMEQIAAAVALRKALLLQMNDARLLQELQDLRTRYVIAVGGTPPSPPQPQPDPPAREDMLAEAENLWDQLRLVYNLTHERHGQIATMRSIGLGALGAVVVGLLMFAIFDSGLFAQTRHATPAAAKPAVLAKPAPNGATPMTKAGWIPIVLTEAVAAATPAQTDAAKAAPADPKKDAAAGVTPTTDPKKDLAAGAASTVDPKAPPAPGAAPTPDASDPPKAYGSRAKLNAMLNVFCVVFAASGGAIVSILQRMYVAATLDPLAADPVRQISGLRLGRSGLFAAALMGPASALVLVMAFASGAVAFASITPAFVPCNDTAASGFIFLDHCAAAATRKDAALILVWSFVAGFSERLVPDVLDRFVKAVNSGGKGA